MSINSSIFHDVIIAGAGPVGLFLATELRRAGCSVLVLEQAPDPAAPMKGPPLGLRGLSVPTVESFDRRGLLAGLTARAQAGHAAHSHGQARRPAGHFAGIQFFHDRIDPAAWPYRLPDATEGMAADMADIEAMLAAAAAALGVEIRRGWRVDDVVWSDDGVTVHSGDQTIRAGWLVGCDGGRSVVRKAAGFGFVGTDPEFTGYSVLATLADAEGLLPGRHNTPTGMYNYMPPGKIWLADFDGGAFHRGDPLTPAHIEGVLRRISGTNVTVRDVHLAGTWTDRAFQATEYRRGRVLLAGDAAHIHSPLGGQGLNLGLGDAMNLGWKLAATIRGDAPADLLESYARERVPVAAQILD